MDCSKCGEKLAENALFCASCGTPVASEPAAAVTAQKTENSNIPAGTAYYPDKAKKSLTKPLLIAAAVMGAVLIILGAVLMISRLSTDSGSEKYPLRSELLLIKGMDQVDIYAGSAKPVTINGEMYSHMYSLDGKRMALSMDRDSASNLSSLWYCDGKTAVSVAEDVYVFVFSGSGTKIAYLADYDMSKGVGDLYTYDVDSKKKELAAEDVTSAFVLSPDGRSYAYVSDLSKDSSGKVDSMTGYLRINGAKAAELGKNQYAIALADNGKYIYYLEKDKDNSSQADLFIRTGKTDEKAGTVQVSGQCIFNADNSQILFRKGTSTYICSEGKSKVKVSGSSLTTVETPVNLQLSYNVNASMYALSYNVKSLADLILVFSDNGKTENTRVYSIGYLQKDMSAQVIEDNLDVFPNTTLSLNGKSLYYLNESGKIVYYKNFRDQKAEPVKIDGEEDIAGYTVMPDQSAVYYVDSEKTLWVQRGTSDPEEISGDVRLNSIQISKDGKGIYFFADYADTDYGTQKLGGGTLNFIVNKAKAKAIEIADDVYRVDVSDYGTVYYVYDSTDTLENVYIGEAFLSTNDKNFVSVMDEVNLGSLGY